MPLYRLKDGVEGGKDLPTLNEHFAPGETKEVPVDLNDPDFELVPTSAPAKPTETSTAPKGDE